MPRNPIMSGGDPFVLNVDGKYYLYPTKDPDGFRVYESTDLRTWTDKGMALKKEDTFADKWFWAPEVIFHNGYYYMTFTAEEHLGFARSESPLGPFKQIKKEPISDKKMIDGSFFKFKDEVYFYYVLLNKRNEIHVAKMNNDMMSVDFSTDKLIIYPEDKWELKYDEWPVSEGPFAIEHNNLVYLTYSCNHTHCRSYAVGCAISDSPFGPYKKCPNNPILHTKNFIRSVGHNSLFYTNDGKLMMAYHSHKSIFKIHPRMVHFAKVKFKNKNGIDLLYVDGPKIAFH